MRRFFCSLIAALLCVNLPAQRIHDIIVHDCEIKTTGTENGHDWVDLGLSVKWATSNVGAEKPEDYGGYYAWGEIETKSTYSWLKYKYCEGNYISLMKYCMYSAYGSVDDKILLETIDDVAVQSWGGSWRMPTDVELRGLLDSCTWVWTTLNSVNGYRVSSSNGNSIFLPAAGYMNNNLSKDGGVLGLFWSSKVMENGIPYKASNISFSSSSFSTSSSERNCGLSVRPVCP